MIFSISPRCAPEMLCACPATRAERQHEAGGERRDVRSKRMEFSPFRIRCASATRAAVLGAYDIVGLDPTGRADREAGLGARRKLARGLVVAAHEGGERRGKIGLREVALAAIGHGELGIAVRPIRARARARCAAARPPRRRTSGRSVAFSACASRTWISAGCGASWIARRSGAIASAGLPPSSSAWPFSSWK